MTDRIQEKRNNMESLSAPIQCTLAEKSLRPQLSAPSHFVSLENNEAPPFQKYGIEIKPMLLVWSFLSEMVTEEIMKIAKFGDSGLKLALEQQIVHKNFAKKYEMSEKHFLTSLLVEAFRYGERLNFNVIKISTLLTIYVNAHKYFKSYYWLPPKAIWAYFKELMFRHSINDSEDGFEVFEPSECYEIMSHFHAIYICNLPLIHIRVFGAHQLKMSWVC